MMEVVKMAQDRSIYQSPMSGRYASKKMKYLFSQDKKFQTWRRLWVVLAKAERQLGLPVTEEQIEEMLAYVDNINYDEAEAWERAVRHDVMAHVHAYGQQCPKATGIIHLGATSCYVTDNTDILLIREGLILVKQKLLRVIKNLAEFADKYKAMPTLGYTHFQAATPTTVGKRATLWLQNFMENLEELNFVLDNLKLLGCRGATGTSETFLRLFDGDDDKVRQLDELICTYLRNDMEDYYAPVIRGVYPVSGQTYPRNLDIRVMNCLASIAASAHKMATDIRLLQHEKELEEPFGDNQIGSSAMAYKRNPMRSERICSLARGVQGEATKAYGTADTQWLERTLDDSAVRRTMIPEGFLGTDAVLILCANVTDGLVVYPEMIRRHLEAELPFMVVEDVIMRCVEKGGDRQEVHERVRRHAMEAAKQVKLMGEDNHLVESLMLDVNINTLVSEDEIRAMMDPERLIGCCVQQVQWYLMDQVWPTLRVERNVALLQGAMDMEVKV